MARPAKDRHGAGVLTLLVWIAAVVAVVLLTQQAIAQTVSEFLAGILVTSLDLVVRLIAALFGQPSA
jgi:hypothetical protein